MQERNIALAIVLTIITCGIYGIYWFIVVTDETRIYSEDVNMTPGGIAFLLTLITCGIYGFYWAYKMGKAIEKALEKNGITPNDNSILFLILQIIGFAIINYALMQNEINEITRKRAQKTT